MQASAPGQVPGALQMAEAVQQEIPHPAAAEQHADESAAAKDEAAETDIIMAEADLPSEPAETAAQSAEHSADAVGDPPEPQPDATAVSDAKADCASADYKELQGKTKT